MGQGLTFDAAPAFDPSMLSEMSWCSSGLSASDDRFKRPARSSLLLKPSAGCDGQIQVRIYADAVVRDITILHSGTKTDSV